MYDWCTLGSKMEILVNAPTSGASGTFAGGVNTATTSAQGVAARGSVLQPMATTGSYTVTAKIGLLSASPGFALTNTNLGRASSRAIKPARANG